MRFPRVIREVAIGIVPLLSVGSARANAAPQTPPSCKNFGLVNEWKGTLSLVGIGSGTLSDGGTYSVNESITASPDLNAQGAGSWTGNFNETIHVDDMESHPDGTFTHITDDETIPQGPISAVSGGFLPGAGLNANLSACTFEFDWDPSLHATIASNSGTETGTPSQYGFVGLQLSGSAAFTAGSIQSPLPTTGLVLSGNFGVNYFSALLGDPANWTLTWSLNPVLDLDLIVTIPQYSTWRPTGGATEVATGLDASGKPNLLTIQGLLVDKTTQKPLGFPPDKMTFKLVNPSKEPGVTMNWPPQNQLISSAPPDLSFDPNQPVNASFNLVPFTISPDGTQADIGPVLPSTSEPVTIVLSPHDWGGWATLNVTATAAGQVIQGHLTLPSGQNVTDILLPLRQPGSFIADGWKNDHNISLSTPDTDDSETSPDNNPYPGDGLSLYEEYRGFYVHCPTFDGVPGSGCIGGLMHREGDPTKKDLFVVNEMGPDALAGIIEFASGSGVNVCCRTLGSDQITQDHIINFNHAQGPHGADQHAVIIVKGNPNANPCTQTVSGGQGAAQPKDISKIFVPPLRDVLALAMQKGDTAQFQWAQKTYPGAVAHEIGHSVYISHHGQGDTQWVGWTTLDGTSILEGGGLTLVHVFTENGKELTAPNLNLSLGKILTTYRGDVAGQHSGDVFCFMRYNISQQYISASDPSRRYFVARESLGSYLTDIAQGTGTNSSTHFPQSRYGNASAGDCSRQMCVSDALNPPAKPVGPPCSGQN